MKVTFGLGPKGKVVINQQHGIQDLQESVYVFAPMLLILICFGIVC